MSLSKKINDLYQNNLQKQDITNILKKSITSVIDDHSIIVCNKNYLIKLFILYCVNYYHYINQFGHKTYVGIDFEFAETKIALMQIIFKEKSNYIWLVNPGEFTEDQNNIFIEFILINPNIYKILHGPDSLDIPYIHEGILKNDNDMMISFVKTLIDTRFICEYYRYSVGENPKCSIYNALLYFDVINKKKYKYLDKLHDSFDYRQWNINEITRDQLNYAIYDVFYLKKFLDNMYKKASKTTPDMFVFYDYLTHIIRFVYLSKRQTIPSYKSQVDKINNYFVKTNMKLIDIYNQVMNNIVISEIQMDINILMSINYLRSTLNVFFKKIVYSIISLNYDVYEKKNIIMSYKIDNTDLFNLLDQLQMEKIKRVTVLFQSHAYVKIKSIISI